METGKLDLSHMDKDYYSARERPELIAFGDMRYIIIEGHGAPGGVEYAKKINMLYALAYALKNDKKKEGTDFVVPKLECQYWADQGETFDSTSPERWNWKLMIRIPVFVTRDDIEEAKFEILDKKGMAGIRNAKLQSLSMGLCVQALHKGPYERVGETYDRIMGFVAKKGLNENGPYHEVYLSNPDRTPPEKLKTIVRQPVR